MSGYLSPDETRTLAVNVTRLRQARGWTQEDLARIARISVSTLQKMTRGRHSSQERTLRRLAIALGVADPGQLLRPYSPGSVGAPPPPPTPDEEHAAPPSTPAQAAFSQQVAELMRMAARVQREDPDEGTRIYIQLTGRVRQMTQAVQAERRGDKWLRERRRSGSTG